MNWDKQTIKTILETAKNDQTANADYSNSYIGKVQVRYIIYRMLQAMNARQTETERVTESTSVLNGIGFNGGDAALLCNIANRSVSFRNLTAKQARMVAKRLVKYSGQLAEIAADKKAVAVAA